MPSDKGNYTCLVENEFGSINHTYTLDVVGQCHAQNTHSEYTCEPKTGGVEGGRGEGRGRPAERVLIVRIVCVCLCVLFEVHSRSRCRSNSAAKCVEAKHTHVNMCNVVSVHLYNFHLGKSHDVIMCL